MNKIVKKTSILILCLCLLACQTEQVQVPQITVKKSSTQFSIIATGELEAVKSTPIVATAKTQKPQIIAWIIAQHSFVKAGDVIAKFDGVPFQLEVDQAEYEMAKLMFNKEKKQRELGLSLDDFNNEEQVVDFEYLMAKKFNIDDPMLYTKIEMIEASDNEEFLAAKSEHLKKMGGFFQDKSISEIGLIDSQSQLHESKVNVNKANLSQLEVKAPHDGIVVLKESWDGSLPQAGKSVFPGTKLASLPDLSQMQAKIYVPEIEAVGIKINQPVDIALHAFSDMTFTGRVTQMSKTAQPKERDNPIKYFIVSVLIDQKDTQRLLPGQRVEATILTSDKVDALSLPIQTIFRDGNKTWVYLKKDHNDAFIKQDIITSLCSSSQCIIKSGLKENDIVALTNPNDSIEVL